MDSSTEDVSELDDNLGEEVAGSVPSGEIDDEEEDNFEEENDNLQTGENHVVNSHENENERTDVQVMANDANDVGVRSPGHAQRFLDNLAVELNLGTVGDQNNPTKTENNHPEQLTEGRETRELLTEEMFEIDSRQTCVRGEIATPCILRE